MTLHGGGRAGAVVAVALSATVFGVDAATTNVAVKDFEFAPARVTVDAGDEVAWMFATGDGTGPHDVTADDGSFASADLLPGGSYRHTFDDPGTFAYYCTFHGGPGGEGMSGTVVVAGGLASTEPTSSSASTPIGTRRPEPSASPTRSVSPGATPATSSPSADAEAGVPSQAPSSSDLAIGTEADDGGGRSGIAVLAAALALALALALGAAIGLKPSRRRG